MTPIEKAIMARRGAKAHAARARRGVVKLEQHRKKSRLRYNPELTERDKSIVRMYRRKGFTYAELSDMMLVSIGTAFDICLEEEDGKDTQVC